MQRLRLAGKYITLTRKGITRGDKMEYLISAVINMALSGAAIWLLGDEKSGDKYVHWIMLFLLLSIFGGVIKN